VKFRLTRFSVLAVGLAAASTNLHAAAQPVKSPGKVKDLAGRVEVVPSGRLRPMADGHAQVRVSLWNSTENDIHGPVFLVVDSTGIKDVTLENHPDQTASGKGVFEVLSAGEMIPAHGMTSAVALGFATPAGFDQEQANSFKLKARAFGREVPSQYATDKHEDDDFATQGKSYDAARLNEVMAIQERATAQLTKNPGVFGTGIAENSRGELVMRVYTETRGQAKNLPGSVEGVALDVRPIPGGFKADPARDTVIFKDGKALSKASRDAARTQSTKTKASSASKPNAAPGGDPTIRFDRPVPIGSSAFNATDVCASGTLGFRCRDSSGKVYAVSNAHVFAKESLSSLGESMIQPSQGDSNCIINLDDDKIGELVDFVNWNLDPTGLTPPGQLSNFMDCALMEVFLAKDPNGNDVPAVDTATPEDGYGTPSSKIVRVNRIGLQVQKYGRTSIYTRGFTSATNVFSLVGGSTGVVAYYHLDEFLPVAPHFSLGQPGDSGSLIVTVDGNRPVSLLFAGGGNETLGNPIGRVLDRFNVKVDDGTQPVTTEGDGNFGSSGRVGIAVSQVGQDLDIIGLLPPELQGRVKNPKQNNRDYGPREVP
jgi:hypothetical protein